MLLLNYIDIEYFKFIDKRTTYDIFHLIFTGNDTLTLLPAFIKDFWYIPLMWLVNVFLLYKFRLNIPWLKRDLNIKNLIRSFTFIVVNILIFIILYRGIGLRPLSISSAAKYTDSQKIPLVLNTPFSIIRSVKNALDRKTYFETEVVLNKYIKVCKHYNRQVKNRKNVVIIILESFGKDYTGFFNNKPYTPFLDSLISQSLYSSFSFANGKKSMEAMPAIIAGIPALSDNPFITSQYSANKINSLVSLLKTKGYYSAFFHGGKNGTMGFDNFAYLAGFDKYYGKNEYPNPNDFDGTWGIYDEEFLSFFADKITGFKQPFIATVFTLSSHHPYNIPDKYDGVFKAGELPIHKAVEYADYSLKQFFAKVKKTSWYKNTLFVLTADHSSYTNSKYYGNKTGMYSIPIIYFAPNDSTLKGDAGIITQQIDIMPSVLDYLGYNGEFFCLGNSIFSDKNEHYAVNYISGIYQIFYKNYSLLFDGKETVAVYNFKTDSLLRHNLVKEVPEKELLEYENKLKAIIQTYNNSLIDNKMYCKN
jgi:phosphoglycerol transferase MdoB-like AlkP superfamily enzyme